MWRLESILFWSPEFTARHTADIDFIITLGGDGTGLIFLHNLISSFILPSPRVHLTVKTHHNACSALHVVALSTYAGSARHSVPYGFVRVFNEFPNFETKVSSIPFWSFFFRSCAFF
jgi:hypothetical protein